MHTLILDKSLVLVFLVGIVVGFLGGLFGKGGSAIATPLLSLIGLPGFVAVAAPLPATVPGTFIASLAYLKSDMLNWKIVRWSIFIGVPVTMLGSYLTRYIGPRPLLVVTGLLVLGFGLSFLFSPKEGISGIAQAKAPKTSTIWTLRLVLVAVSAGLISGLLANSGGFLLAPGYARFLHQPIKKAFACSLAVSMFLALPATFIHAFLGHIDWTAAITLAIGSVPFSWLGAKVAIKSNPKILERLYGVALTFLGGYFLLQL